MGTPLPAVVRERLSRSSSSEPGGTTVAEFARRLVSKTPPGLQGSREAEALVCSAIDAFEELRASGPEPFTATDPLVETGIGVRSEDLEVLRAMECGGRQVAVRLENRGWTGADEHDRPFTHLRIFVREREIALSDMMPILENAGLRVLAPIPVAAGPASSERLGVVFAFAVQDLAGRALDLELRGAALEDALVAVQTGRASNDALNCLVLRAGLTWREVELLRAYVSYAYQAGLTSSRSSMVRALCGHPEIARLFVQLFQRRFEPGRDDPEAREQAVGDVLHELERARSVVRSLNVDRLFAAVQRLVLATVRTNYYLSPASESPGTRDYLSIKLAMEDLEGVVSGTHLYETWVRSPRMEGVHIRGMRVARGGIRWSDRVDDFRSEILGLVQTQMVKNAVIVPSGAKGGFVVLTDLDSPGKASREEARDQYRTLIRGLLDITDNLGRDGRPRTPDGVVCYDRADPYLVVAADKGTAPLSDVANQVATDYGYWLGDAFASGGSRGYDHKGLGITALGAWECVRRHFREMGRDLEGEEVSVAGIGDMSGDVFGNGMLLSRRLRLVAAFDHRHIFIDPDPDPEIAWRERSRLFRMEASSWDDYDRDALSPGGMIVPRDAKELTLDPRASAALGLEVEATTVDGEALVRAILKAPVDLLWNGGIGTYVKASDESHPSVGDPENDAVRVDAADLRCGVVGEGGNRGLTQRARVEFALGGGRLNTDALDNSAGVNLSDREVNLKILLRMPDTEGLESPDDRIAILEAAQEAVVERVLRDSHAQAVGVALDEIRAGERVDEFLDLMDALEGEGRLDRERDGLPSTEDVHDRRGLHPGLSRPELAVLAALVKLGFKEDVLRGGLVDDRDVLTAVLRDYFPPEVSDHPDLAPERHLLRREIFASRLANRIVDVMGATFPHRVAADTACSPEQIARAWLAAAQILDLESVLAEIGAYETSVPIETTNRWRMAVSDSAERLIRWLLDGPLSSHPVVAIVAAVRGHLDSILGRTSETLGEREHRALARIRDEVSEAGVGEAFAGRMARIRMSAKVLPLVTLARTVGPLTSETVALYHRVCDILHEPWLRRRIGRFTISTDRWDRRAARALETELEAAQCKIVRCLLRGGDPSADDRLERNAAALSRLSGLVREVRGRPEVTLAALAVVVHEINSISDRMVVGCEPG